MLKTEGYRTDYREISGVKVSVTTYKIGDRFHCHVANAEPGATIARTEAASFEEAENLALAKTTERLQGATAKAR